MLFLFLDVQEMRVVESKKWDSKAPLATREPQLSPLDLRLNIQYQTAVLNLNLFATVCLLFRRRSVDY